MGLLKAIIARVGMDASEFELGAKKVEGIAEHTGEEIAHHFKAALAGAFGAEAFRELVEKEIEFGEKTVDLSHRLGMSTDAVQIWDFALKRNGSTIEAAAGFFEKLGTARHKALSGDTKAIEDFKQLGVAIEDLKSKRIEDVAAQMSEVFSAGGDPQRLIEALRSVGGKGAGEMVATLRDGIQEVKKEMEELGLVISNSVLQKLKETGDRQKQIGAEIRAWTAGWIADMTEGFQFLLDAFRGTFASIKAFIGSMGELNHTGLNFKQMFLKSVDKAVDASQEVFNARIDSDRALRLKAARDQAPLPPGDEGGPDHKRNRETARANKEAQKKEDANSMIGVPESVKRKVLKEAIKDVDSFVGPEDEDSKARRRLKRAELQGELLESEKKDKGGKNLTVDHLAKMGGFVGGAEQVLANLAKENLAANRATAVNTAAIAARLAEIPKSTFDE